MPPKSKSASRGASSPAAAAAAPPQQKSDAAASAVPQLPAAAKPQAPSEPAGAMHAPRACAVVTAHPHHTSPSPLSSSVLTFSFTRGRPLSTLQRRCCSPLPPRGIARRRPFIRSRRCPSPHRNHSAHRQNPPRHRLCHPDHVRHVTSFAHCLFVTSCAGTSARQWATACSNCCTHQKPA